MLTRWHRPCTFPEERPRTASGRHEKAPPACCFPALEDLSLKDCCHQLTQDRIPTYNTLTMWERRISHEGLKAYRVIRGKHQEEADAKAAVGASEERWRKNQAIQKARDNRCHASVSKHLQLAIAQQQTEEARSELARSASILARALARKVSTGTSGRTRRPAAA